jgi:uridine kinase
MTIVINMLGGSGIGKSTAAAGLYHQMKMNTEYRAL